MNDTAHVSTEHLLQAGTAVVQREAAFLDEAKWQDWLALYAADCEFWTPSWRSDGTLTEDPKRELSHVYIKGKGGLEDRIMRVHATLAASSVPLQRTTHLLSASHFVSAPESTRLVLATTWNSHVYFPRTRHTNVFFGKYEHTLVLEAGAWKIRLKKIVVRNDFVPTMMDVYCI